MRSKKFIKHVPNILTSIRIILSVVGVLLVYIDKLNIAIIIYIMAALTDLFDGVIARKYNAMSKLGIKLDQISDKLLTLSLGICLILLKNYTVIIILGLEFLIVLINALFKLIVKKWPKSLKTGKLKTALLFITLIFGFLKEINPGLDITYKVLLIITIILEVLAFISYVVYLIYEKRAKNLE